MHHIVHADLTLTILPVVCSYISRQWSLCVKCKVCTHDEHMDNVTQHTYNIGTAIFL